MSFFVAILGIGVSPPILSRTISTADEVDYATPQCYADGDSVRDVGFLSRVWYLCPIRERNLIPLYNK